MKPPHLLIAIGVMNYFLSRVLTLSSVLLIASACTQGQEAESPTSSGSSSVESPAVVASPDPNPILNPLAPTDGSSESSTTENPPSAQSSGDSSSDTPQVYREPNGLFEISLPSDYKFEETGSGIAFASGDEGFAGSVDYGSAQGQTLTNEDMEAALKSEYEERLKEVTWQGSEVQPDGSVRVDWVGTDPQGNQLDAISFVEQRGDTIYILNLFGVNQAYQNYNQDAEVIVGSYRVRS